MYRGLSVGPHILQSILMAFESWLFEYAKTFPQQLDSTLVDILRRSESASEPRLLPASRLPTPNSPATLWSRCLALATT